MNNEITFENWFEIFLDEVKRLGYTGIVDQDSARMDYDACETPEAAAKLFVRECQVVSFLTYCDCANTDAYLSYLADIILWTSSSDNC